MSQMIKISLRLRLTLSFRLFLFSFVCFKPRTSWFHLSTLQFSFLSSFFLKTCGYVICVEVISFCSKLVTVYLSILRRLWPWYQYGGLLKKVVKKRDNRVIYILVNYLIHFNYVSMCHIHTRCRSLQRVTKVQVWRSLVLCSYSQTQQITQ